jgi:hypothetical protein
MARSKKKKKISPVEQQKLQQAQYKNLFKEKLIHLCKLIGDASLYNLIPSYDQEKIYRLRGAPLKIKIAKGAKIQKRLLEVLEKLIRQILLQQTIEIMPDTNLRVSIGDYFSVCSALENVLASDECTFSEEEHFNRFLKSTNYREEQYNEEILKTCQLVCSIYDDLSQKRLYSFTTDFYSSSGSAEQRTSTINKYAKNRQAMLNYFHSIDFRIHNDIVIDTLPLELQHVTIDNEKRPVIPLGVVLYPKYSKPLLHCFTIPMEQLKVQSPFGKLSVPVYIQQHALNRLMERTGILIPGYCVISMQISFTHPTILPIGNNRFLIEYYLNELKVGYFLSELKDGILVLRTFLFLTNGGTPEGDKLAKMTHLQRADREYLSIDNLRTLANSDILEDERLCQLFRDAGCKSILQICEQRRTNPESMFMIGLEEQKTSLSELINEYLNPDANNEEYVVGE